MNRAARRLAPASAALAVLVVGCLAAIARTAPALVAADLAAHVPAGTTRAQVECYVTSRRLRLPGR